MTAVPDLHVACSMLSVGMVLTFMPPRRRNALSNPVNPWNPLYNSSSLTQSNTTVQQYKTTTVQEYNNTTVQQQGTAADGDPGFLLILHTCAQSQRPTFFHVFFSDFFFDLNFVPFLPYGHVHIMLNSKCNGTPELSFCRGSRFYGLAWPTSLPDSAYDSSEIERIEGTAPGNQHLLRPTLDLSSTLWAGAVSVAATTDQTTVSQ